MRKHEQIPIMHLQWMSSIFQHNFFYPTNACLFGSDMNVKRKKGYPSEDNHSFKDVCMCTCMQAHHIYFAFCIYHYVIGMLLYIF